MLCEQPETVQEGTGGAVPSNVYFPRQAVRCGPRLCVGAALCPGCPYTGDDLLRHPGRRNLHLLLAKGALVLESAPPTECSLLSGSWDVSASFPPHSLRGSHPHKPTHKMAKARPPPPLPTPYLDGTAQHQQQHLLNFLHTLP